MTVSEPPPSPLIIHLFGPMQVLIHGQPLPPLRSRKALWLLALLVLRGGRPVERQWLSGTLWPEVDETSAAHNLRVLLSELRRALGDQEGCVKSPSRHTVSFDPTGIIVDVSAFDAAVLQREPAALAQAVALYRGPLLEGCTEDWAVPERLSRERDCLQALQTLADAALASADYETAISHYRRAIRLDALAEAAQRGLMEALSQGGDLNAALDAYQAFVRLLRRDDPKASPHEKTSTLYARLRAEARRRASVPKLTATVEEAAPPTVTGYLPHPITDLVGREDERIEIAATLRRSRLVTLTGPGGIGKTRMALTVAADVVREFPDGVYLIALDGLSEGTQIHRHLADVFGLQEEPGRTPEQSLMHHLRSKRLLLVLDNCEHLLQASADIAGQTLRECAGVRVLATSRQALGVTGETAWTVPPLSVPDLTSLPENSATLQRVLMAYDGVQLFVERAQAIQKGFAPSGENARAVATVCTQLEGIPLALELAAARIRALTVTQISERLNDRLGLLTGGSRTALSRQQTLRATIDWSYHLLTEPERALLARLSVFAGGWTLPAAEAVCAAEEPVLDLLTNLVDKSLVLFDTSHAAEAGPRYRLLEMVRQYAAERLQASGEAERIRTRHRAWFLALAEESEPLLQGNEAKEAMKRLESEHGNLRTALEWNASDALDGEDALRLASALIPFWSLRNDYRGGNQYLQLVLERDRERKVTVWRARVLQGMADIAYHLGNIAVATEQFEESLRLFQELGDKRGSATTLSSMGYLAQNQGDYARAKALLEESLSLSKEADFPLGVAQALSNLGNILRQKGDYPASREAQEESLRIFREVGNKSKIARTLNSLGNVARLQGDHATAKMSYEEELQIGDEMGDKNASANALSGLGALAYLEGNLEASLALNEESLHIRRELGHKMRVAWSLNHLGLIAMKLNRYDAAKAMHQESLGLFEELGDIVGSAWSVGYMG